ncbi:MAG: sensor histidine kinase [Acidimicrobiia bacterium]|nr:sensor histidine kinase [Acidimicrobiia bacterium]
MEHLLVSSAWRRSLGLLRIGFAAGYLALGWVEPVPAAALAAASLYGLGGAWVIYTGSLYTSLALGLLLGADLAMFLVSALWPPGSHGVYLNLSWFGFIQIAVVLFHQRGQVLLAAAAAVAAILAAPSANWHGSGAFFLGTTVLAGLACWQKQQLVERVFSVSRQSVLHKTEASRARQEERERIASDFHDGPLQAFMSVQMRLEVVRKLLLKNPDSGLKELTGLQDLLQAQVAELRAFLRSMRPAEMDSSELMAALSRLTGAFQKETGISVTFSGTPAVDALPPEAASEILQIVREALHNVRKHAKATSVSVGVEFTDGHLQISIHDNGEGFPFCGTFHLEELELLRMGPGSIKRRARSLSAEMVVESAPGKGSGLLIRIPQ